jgi:dephospho-CoA kinase
LKVGLTGGIGCGKTTVSDRFQKLGVDVIDADVIAHQVSAPGEPVLEVIAAQFGADVIDAGGSLDRARLRAEVFGNPEKRRQLEAILHPVIRNRMEALARDSTTAVLHPVDSVTRGIEQCGEGRQGPGGGCAG